MCLDRVKDWLAHNFLSLNKGDAQAPSLDLSCISPFRSQQVRNLGVILDALLKFDKQISAVIGSSFYQLRLLSKIKHFLRSDCTADIGQSDAL